MPFNLPLFYSRILVRIASLATLTLGVAVLIGWHLRIPLVIQIHPDLVPMQYNTALAFALAGLGLFIAGGGHRRLPVMAAGGAVGLVGALTLVEHVSGADLGIDQLFMRHFITLATSHPGRMAPNTAVCFMLAGAALLLAGTDRPGAKRWRAIGSLSALVVGLAVVAMAGYWLGIPTAYGWGNLTRMAVHTAVGFAILGGGLLIYTWQEDQLDRDWWPWTLGIAGATVAITLWQALQASATDSKVLAEDLMLAFGLAMAYALALAVADSRKARAAIAATEQAVARLGQEMLERKQAEDRVAELNRDFVSFLENTSDFVYFKDANSRFRFCSQTMATITGHAHWRDMIGKHDFEVFPKDTAQIYYDEELPIFRDGKPLLNKVDPYYDAAGNSGWVATNKWPLLDHDGKVVGLFGISRDVTALKQAEESLRESEARFRMMFEHNDSVMLLVDPDSGAIEDANAAASRFYGYPIEQLRAMKIDQINALPPAAVSAELAQAASHGRNHFVFPHRIADGQIRTVEVHSSPVKSGGRSLLVSIIQDITERRKAEDLVRQLAFYDPLTKLPNRRLLIDRLGQTMAASKRSGCYCTLMFLDLDNFKPLNDSHGHEVGDLLLIEVADRLKRCVREVDTVARFGGDEFIVILSDLHPDRAESTAQAEVVAEKIRAALSVPYRLTLTQEDKTATVMEHHCTASIGVVVFMNHDASVDDLLKWADTAMYRAKQDGRDQIRFHDPQAR